MKEVGIECEGDACNRKHIEDWGEQIVIVSEELANPGAWEIQSQ